MNNQLQSTRIFAIAIIAGITLFGGIAIYLNKIGHAPLAPELNPIINYAGIIIAAACISFAFILFKRKSEAASAARDSEKADLFRSAIVLQFALLDGPAIFNVIAYLLSGNNESLVIAACCIIVMLVQFPTEDKFNRFGN